jgi:hypothetical protein
MYSYVALTAAQALTTAAACCVLPTLRSQTDQKALQHKARKICRQAMVMNTEFEKLVGNIKEHDKELMNSEKIAIKFQKEFAIYTKESKFPLTGQEISLPRLELWRKAIEDWRTLIERDRRATKLSRDITLCQRRILELIEKMLQSKAIEDRRELMERKRKYQKGIMLRESGEMEGDRRLLGYERRLMECERDFRKCDLKLLECERGLWRRWDFEFKSWEDQRKLRKSEREVIEHERMLLTHERKSWQPRKGILPVRGVMRLAMRTTQGA